MLELNEKIKGHFRNPQNVGEIENPEGMRAINNPVCGDTTKLYLKIKNGVVEDAKFLSFGCAVTIASASVFTQKIRGKEISKLFLGTDEEVVRRLVNLTRERAGRDSPDQLHCPPATVEVFLESIAGYLGKEGKIELRSRAKSLIPKISEYYKRGEEKE